ncbi:unnamed protein product [Fraxinus pennsylvanica]|uniref:Uncharacterized protein n=1 Tax=Fraxinus pennsylvanica TaxID=56036 RepID=A0AAD1ZMV9_9LAMI|nr:unnamed protein product [Fraxinus pennsylvanica]
MTNGMTDLLSLMDPLVIDSMKGVLDVKPHVPKRKRHEFTVRWNIKHEHKVELNMFGLRAFRGLSGEFHIFNGQLQSSTFRIVNVLGEGEIGIGFWTRENGFLRRLNVRNLSKYNISKDKLKPIIWPREIMSMPKGWVTPTNGKTLRIGVPSTTFFPELVEANRDSNKKLSTVNGYCIDVFNVVMEILPYEFISFQKPNGESAESGVRLLVPLKEKKKNAWIFLRPLTWQLWLTSGCYFLWIGLMILILESHNMSGPQQIYQSFWRTFTHIVHSNIEQLKPSITHIQELVKSGQDVAYQKNAFVLGILEQLNVPKSQMKTFRTHADLHVALQNGSLAR